MLESALDETLCVRNRSAFQLTASGARLYQTTQKIFQELEGFTLSQKDENQFDGILSIGILDHFENDKFAGEISIGLGIFSQRSPRLKYIKIGDESLHYYISNNHALWKKKKIQKEDLFGQKTTWLDNQNRKLSDLEINIFVENLKYKMQIAAFSNNLSGALQILLSGHAIVPLPEKYGISIAKQFPVRRIDVTTKHKTLDQMLVYQPSLVSSSASLLLHNELERNPS